jgi:hypothetical protein
VAPLSAETKHAALSSPFNPSGILSCPSVTLIPASLHPSQHLAVKLWQIFVDRIDGCAELKVLHIPTDEVKAYSTISNAGSAPLEDLAFCFAIYFASAVSLDGPEANEILGQDKATFLSRCKVGLEQALAHRDFLNRPTFTGLRALAIYLVSLHYSLPSVNLHKC